MYRNLGLRKSEGEFHTLHIYVNMSTTQSQILFKKIENVIQKRNTNFRKAITTIEKLAIYLILACL